MKINDLKKRLSKNRKSIEFNLRIPEDILEDLRRIAPQLGFSNVEALIRSYIGQGLRKDLEKIEQTPEVSSLIETLRRKGIKDGNGSIKSYRLMIWLKKRAQATLPDLQIF